MFFSAEAEDSPGTLTTAKTPNQSVLPISRQESETNQVDPVILARRLADIPNVSNVILTPNAAVSNSRLNSIESPPYGAANNISAGGNQHHGTLFHLPLALGGLLRSSGLNSSGSLTPQSYG